MKKKSILKTIIITFLLITLLIPLYSSTKCIPKKKNIILFISDGCGYNHIDATNLYSYGKTGVQVYEYFPVKVAMSTYNYYGSYESSYLFNGPTSLVYEQYYKFE